MKKYFVLITTAFLILLLMACSQQGVNKSKDIVDSKVIKDYDYLNKEFISLEDTEKLFKDENVKLAIKELEKSDFSILQQKYPINYYIDNDKNKRLLVYVFASENERANARKEYDEKTVAMNMAYREIYEVKNIMIFLIAGNTSNEYYQKISKVLKKLK